MTTRAGKPPFPLPDKIAPFVQTLVDSVIPGGMNDLNMAVENAKAQELDDFTRWGIVDGESFLKYASGLMNWTPRESLDGRALYDVMCMFHFVLSMEPIGELQNPITPDQVGKPLLPVAQWVVEYSRHMAAYLDTEESLTYGEGGSFHTYNVPAYNLGQADFTAGLPKTFNTFFYRKLLPGMRPVYKPEDDKIITWPADSTFDQGLFQVDQQGEVDIKGLKWKITDLLQGSEFGDKFAGGQWMHAFLNPTDYHREHAPIGGTVVESKVIQGMQYVQIQKKRDPETGKWRLINDRRWTGIVEPPISGFAPLVSGDLRELEAPNEPGYQFLQTRGSFIIHNPTVGYVATLPIGMGLISSVVPTVKKGDTVQKGDEISYFAFGGSDIVVVFQKDANVDLKHLYNNQHYCVGQLLGTASPM